MKDVFNRDIKVNDTVVYTSSPAYGGPQLSFGAVIGYCKNGSDQIRVRVFKSSNYGFVYGIKDWRSNVVKRKPGQSYVVTIGMSSRVFIINESSQAISKALFDTEEVDAK